MSPPPAHLLQTGPSGLRPGRPQGQSLQHQPSETALEQTRPQGESQEKKRGQQALACSLSLLQLTIPHAPLIPAGHECVST